MFTSRLKAVRRIEDSHRSYMVVLNGVAKSREKLEKENISKDQNEYKMLREKSMARVRKGLVKRLILKRCMDNQKGMGLTAHDKELFGQYGGRTVFSFAQEANSFQTDRSPQMKKKKNMSAILEKSKLRGSILDDQTMKKRVEDYLVQKWGFKLKEKEPIDKVTIEHQQFKHPKPRTYDKLPPIFSLYKITMRPLGKVETEKKDTVNTSIGRSDAIEPFLGKPETNEKRPPKRRAYRKLECRRPTCDGYNGYELKGQGIVLPPILQRIAVATKTGLKS